jgi:uncharacterized phage protein (TIGR01671 family)
MREILLRGKPLGKHKAEADDEEWVYGICHNSSSIMYFEFTNKTTIELRVFNVIPETIGQYTGVDDKNGVKIFEGDIVCHPYQKGTVAQEIVFYNAAFHSVGKCNVIIGELSQRNIEVIGNIHDNPELLKGEE